MRVRVKDGGGGGGGGDGGGDGGGGRRRREPLPPCTERWQAVARAKLFGGCYLRREIAQIAIAAVVPVDCSHRGHSDQMLHDLRAVGGLCLLCLLQLGGHARGIGGDNEERGLQRVLHSVGNCTGRLLTVVNDVSNLPYRVQRLQGRVVSQMCTPPFLEYPPPWNTPPPRNNPPFECDGAARMPRPVTAHFGHLLNGHASQSGHEVCGEPFCVGWPRCVAWPRCVRTRGGGGTGPPRAPARAPTNRLPSG